MERRGTLTEQDLRAALWAHFAPRKSFAVVGALLLILAAWAVWMSFFGEKAQPGLGRLVLPGLLGYLFVHFLVYLPWRTRRAFRQHRALQRQQVLLVQPEGMLARDENGHSTTPWSDFLRWKEGKNLFLLYLSDEMYHIVPKRFFASASEVEAFRSSLARWITR